jgi:hypothetical protein
MYTERVPLVVRGDPGVEPEALDAHQLLLVGAHRAGHVHDVEDHGVGAGLGRGLPRAVAPIDSVEDDPRVLRVVGAAEDRAAQRRSIRALEVPQGLGPDRRDAGVATARAVQLVAPLGPDVRQLEGLAEQAGQLLDGELGLEQVLARLVARAPAFRPLAVALAHPPSPGVVDEVGQLEVRDRDRDDALALAAEQLLPPEMPAQLFADAAPDDLPEAVDVGLDPGHRVSSGDLSDP